VSRGRRHLGRAGVRQRDVRRAEAEASSLHAARQDVITRYAILRHHTAYAWLCRQSNGRAKPGYRTREVAEHVAALLRQLDPSTVFEAYLCHRADSTQRIGEHWHLATPRVLTRTAKGRKVSGVRENDTSPEERTA
jgi:hypothetical protein